MLALIAGQGALPAAVAQAASGPVCVAALDGFFPDGLNSDPELIWRVETLGTLLKRLKDKGVTDVCLCGAVQRPQVDMAAIDGLTQDLVPVMRAALADKGDDGVLRAIMGIFEQAGFIVRAAHDVAPNLLPPKGVLTERNPTEGEKDDARLGDLVSHAQGAADLGQACVIRDGQVIAREDDHGTDEMLAGLVSEQVPDTAEPARSGMFFKAPKPGQDRRADLPVIGPDTVEAVARAGLAGLTVAADGVMVLDRARVVALCNALDLFLWVRHP